MILPWIVLIAILIAAIAGLIYTTKHKVEEHHHHPPPR